MKRLLDLRTAWGGPKSQRMFRPLATAFVCAVLACGGGVVARAGAAHQQTPKDSTHSGDVDALTLTPHTAVERVIRGGMSHSYTFPLSRNQYVHAVVEQRGVDLEVSIFDPDNNAVAEVDRQNGSRGPEAISLIAKKQGTYRLEVHPASKSGPEGGYRVEITELRARVANDDLRVEAERITTEGGKLYAQGGAQGKKELYRESIEKFEQAIKLWRSLGDRYEEAVALYGIGWDYSDLGAYGMVKFPVPLYRVRWSYETRGDHQKAIEYFKQALAYFIETKDSHGQAITYTGLAWPNLYLGNSKEALDFFSKALPLHRSFGNLRGEAFALYGIGWAQALGGNTQEALDDFLQSLPLRQAVKDRRGEATTLAGVCRMYGRLGQSTQGLEFCDRALSLFQALKDSHGIASTLSVKGWSYYSLGRYKDALASFDQALELRRAVQDITGEANALYGIAKVYADQGDLAAALAKMEGVYKLVDPLRAKGSSEELRTYYFASVQDYYDFYIELLMRLHGLHPQDGYAKTALLVKERARARGLLAILAEVVSDVGSEADLEATHPLGVSDIQHMLDEDSLLLEYAVTEGHSYVWAVTTTTVEGFELPVSAAELRKSATAFLRMLKETGGTTQDFETAAGALSSMLLPAKVAARLRVKRKAVVVADDALHYLPFGTLSQSGRRGAYRPLVADHEVVNLPSMSTLRVIRRKMDGRPLAPNTVAVLADPVFRSTDARVRQGADATGAARSAESPRPTSDKSSEITEEDIAKIFSLKDWNAVSGLKLKRLPGTREEAEEIRKLEPSARVELDFDVNFKTATDPQLGTFRIIHFATHGMALDNNPELSGLILSLVDEQGKPQEGWYLDLTSVCSLRLPVELVILSACETSVGKNVRGEGLVGLTRGFMYAGAPRVIASLWEVREEATKELMKRFYAAMLRGRARPSAALSAAQASMWEEQKWAPSDWASFLYSGEWR